MKKILIYSLLFFTGFTINVYSASFKESSRAIMNCADYNFRETNGAHSMNIPQWSKNIDGKIKNWTPKVNDKYILEYINNFPLNRVEHHEIIKENRRKLQNKYFQAIYEASNSEQKKLISELEEKRDTAQNKFLLDSKRGKLYNDIAKTLNNKNVKEVKKELDLGAERDLINLKAHLRAVAKSKYHFFLKMTIKEKLSIKKYKKEHINCEKKYENAKITFIQEWK